MPAVLVFGLAGSARAQSTTEPAATREGRWTIGGYIGGARHSPVGHHLGLTPDRDHFFLGIRATMPISVHGIWFLRFAPEIVPLLIVTNNPTYVEVQSSDNTGRVIVEGHRRPVAGFAISPISLETGVRVSPRWRLYSEGAVGSVWFTRQVPVLDSRAFNFTFQVGGGLQWQHSARTRLRVGYKFHHLSNAHTAFQNPGIDANVLLIGIEHNIGRR